MDMRIIIFGIFVLYTTSKLAESTDSIFVSKSPSVHKVSEGDDLHIPCSVNKTYDIDVYWVKNDTTTSFIQNGTTLTLMNITRSMSGDYICYSQNLTSDYNATEVEVVKVDVLYPAEIVEFNISKKVVNESSYFDVRCQFDGNPTPNFIIWNIKDKPHIFSEGIFPVTDHVQARCEDQGLWECTGRNSLNPRNVTRSGNVTVFCAPHPKYDYMKQSDYRVKRQLGSPCFFKMRNYANPPANYTWSKNGVVFPPEAHIDVTSGNLGASILSIDNIQVEDFGTYSLNMSNAYGWNNQNYQLIPVGPPERPRSLSYSNLTYNSVKLHWVSGFDGGSQQHFVVIRFVDGDYVEFSSKIYERTSTTHGEGEHYEYELTDLEPGTYYLLLIQANNDQGYLAVRSDEEVSFTTFVAPWQTTTAFPYFDNCCTVGLIVGASFGGAGLLCAIIGIVLIVVVRNRRKAYSMLTTEKMPHNHTAPPRQLCITPDMTKANIY